MKILIVIIMIIFSAINIYAGDVAVVSKNSSINSIDKMTLVDIYKLDVLKWSNGNKVSVFFYKEESLCAHFFDAIGTSAKALKKLWLKKTLTGEASAPTLVEGIDAMINAVKADKNAIGFMPEDKVTPDLKVIYKF